LDWGQFMQDIRRFWWDLGASKMTLERVLLHLPMVSLVKQYH